MPTIAPTIEYPLEVTNQVIKPVTSGRRIYSLGIAYQHPADLPYTMTIGKIKKCPLNLQQFIRSQQVTINDIRCGADSRN
jgi:hypothetical protein